MPKFLFPSGQIAITPGADDLLVQLNVHWIRLLARHMTGDWGNLDDEDKKANDLAIENGMRILSAYQFDHGNGQQENRIWVITEADRSATTILLPSEY